MEDRNTNDEIPPKRIQKINITPSAAFEAKTKADVSIEDIPLPEAVRSFDDADFDNDSSRRADARSSANDVQNSLSKYAPHDDTKVFSGIPVGIKIIAGVTALNAAFNIWQASSANLAGQSSKSSVGIPVFALLLSFGLFFMSNFARRFFIFFSVVAILLSFWLYHETLSVQKQYHTVRSSSAPSSSYTGSDPGLASLNDYNNQRYERNKKTAEGLNDGLFVRVYAVLILNIVYFTSIVIYLLRPSIKERF